MVKRNLVLQMMLHQHQVLRNQHLVQHLHQHLNQRQHKHLGVACPWSTSAGTRGSLTIGCLDILTSDKGHRGGRQNQNAVPASTSSQNGSLSTSTSTLTKPTPTLPAPATCMHGRSLGATNCTPCAAQHGMFSKSRPAAHMAPHCTSFFWTDRNCTSSGTKATVGGFISPSAVQIALWSQTTTNRSSKWMTLASTHMDCQAKI